MPRQTRIQLVAGLAFCLIGLLIAIGGPIITVLVAQNSISPKIRNSDDMLVQFQAVQRTAVVGQNLALGGMGLAGGAAIYTLVVLAVWFIGPAERSSPESKIGS